MKTIKRTSTFTLWMEKIQDDVTSAAIAQHIARLGSGLGDVQPVGDGIHELRIHLGAGWRVYFINVAGLVILLLLGGTKRTQKADIAAAKKMLKEMERGTAAAKAVASKSMAKSTPATGAAAPRKKPKHPQK